jgi:hypothetical protein
MKKFFLFFLSLIILCSTAASHGEKDDGPVQYDWDDAQLRAAFDEVARNFGAVEYATYSFMVEYHRVPESLDDLMESGHLNVVMTNPYTEGEVISLTKDDVPDGPLAGNILIYSADEGNEVHVETWPIRRDEDILYTRSMIKRIYIFQSSVEYEYIFENDFTREEQLTAVYCSQSISALESFQQRNGHSPEDFADLYDNGDVNVHYINPMTGELAVNSEELSPGDYFFRKVGDEGFTVIGWGVEEPVFFATTDDSEEEWFYGLWSGLVAYDNGYVADTNPHEIVRTGAGYCCK